MSLPSSCSKLITTLSTQIKIYDSVNLFLESKHGKNILSLLYGFFVEYFILYFGFTLADCLSTRLLNLYLFIPTTIGLFQAPIIFCWDYSFYPSGCSHTYNPYSIAGTTFQTHKSNYVTLFCSVA